MTFIFKNNLDQGYVSQKLPEIVSMIYLSLQNYFYIELCLITLLQITGIHIMQLRFLKMTFDASEYLIWKKK